MFMQMLQAYLTHYNFKNPLTHSILTENIKEIENAIATSFKNEILKRKIIIEIAIDILALYAKNIEAANLIKKYASYLEDINGFIEEIIRETLKSYKYIHIEFINIKSIYSLRTQFKTLPIILDEINKLGIKENLLKIVKGKIAFEKEVIHSSDYGYMCKNKSCVDPVIMFSFDGYALGIKINNKEFEKISFIKKTRDCPRCHMKLDPVYCELNKSYQHMICSKGFWVRFDLSIKLEIREGVVIGLTKRDGNKTRYLEGIMVYSYKASDVRRRYRAKGDNLEKRITNMTAFYMGYKRDIGISDCVLFLILNIFNIRISEGVLDSPESDNFKESEEYKQDIKRSGEYGRIRWKKEGVLEQTNKSKEIACVSIKNNLKDEIKMVIYTNDVFYVKKVAKSLVDVPIIYSMKVAGNHSSFLCIRSVDDREKLLKNVMVDYAFCVHVGGLIEESYERNIFYRVKADEIVVDKNIILSIKDCYLYFRKKMKGNIKPEVLFNTTEAIALSVFHLIGTVTGGSEVSRFLKQNFGDKITQLCK